MNLDTTYKYTHQVIRKWHTGGDTAGTNWHNETQTYKVKQETHRLFYNTKLEDLYRAQRETQPAEVGDLELWS